MDKRIPSEGWSQEDSYNIDNQIFVGKVAAVSYVKKQLNCTLTDAIKYVESLSK